MDRQIEFESVFNVRDLGGIVARDGRAVRLLALLRGGHLADASASDLAKLADLGVKLVVDLRTDSEASDAPNKKVPGGEAMRLPVLSGLTPGISREEEADRSAMLEIAKSAMKDTSVVTDYLSGMYRQLIVDEFSQKRYARFMALLASRRPEDGGVMWNCTAGKDRAGIATAFVLECLGVEREVIMQDYLLTNRYIEQGVQAMLKRVPFVFRRKAQGAVRAFFSADASYLNAAYEAATDLCGSMEAYIAEYLGVTDEMRAGMRESYLVG